MLNSQKVTFQLKHRQDLVKDLAFAKIVALIPGATKSNYITKEMNLLMQGIEFLNKIALGTITNEEQAQADLLLPLITAIKAVRVASNEIEAELISDVNYDWQNSPYWP